MDKNGFLTALGEGLADISLEEREKWLDFYGEMIDDRMEEGLTETEAVEAVGPVENVISQILKQPEVKQEEKTVREPWKWALIIGGAPLWLPILVALAAVVLALLACIYAVAASFVGGAIGGVVLLPTYLGDGNIPGALFALGAVLFCSGIAFLMFRPVLRLTKWLFFKVFRRKEGAV